MEKWNGGMDWNSDMHMVRNANKLDNFILFRFYSIPEGFSPSCKDHLSMKTTKYCDYIACIVSVISSYSGTSLILGSFIQAPPLSNQLCGL